MTNLDEIRELREDTGAGVMDVKRALEESGGDREKAKAYLKKKGLLSAQKKAQRNAVQGVIDVYAHNGRIGSMLELACETDFVARNATFKALAHDISLQIASMNPEDTEELLAQPFFKDEAKTIAELIHENILKIGENIYIKRFVRFQLGE